ncbi:MAG: hypothetical protein AAF993_17930 [Pseudomonadota bacterium]
MLKDTSMLTEAQLIDTEWQENGIILHNCSGVITIEDLARTLLTDLKDSRYATTTASLWDLRGVRSTVNQYDLNYYARYFLDLMALVPKTRRTAWVVKLKMSEAIINSYYREHPWPATWRTFNHRTPAEQWCAKARPD